VRLISLAAIPGLLIWLLAIGLPQQASAAGKFDGEFRGELSCKEQGLGGGVGGDRAETNSNVILKIYNDKIIQHSGLTTPGDKSLSGKINLSEKSVIIKATHPTLGPLLLDGKFSVVDGRGERYINFKGETDDSEVCSLQVWEQNKGRSVATKASPPPQQASNKSLTADAVELQRLAEMKRKKEEDQRIAEADEKRQAEAKRLAGFERQLNERERRLVEAENKRKSEAKRIVEVERKQKVEAKRLVEKERKRKQEEDRQLADTERKRKAESKRVAALEMKRKAAEAQKRKAAPQKASTIGGGGKVQKQLAFLKQLRANGLINEQEFNSRKKALLDKFLGLKQASVVPSTTANPAKEQNTIELNLAKYSDVNFGKYYALVIGSNDYKYLPKLGTAKTDAMDIAEALRTAYGFEVKLLTNATRDEILDAFDAYRKKLTESDNLLIYYAGHGWLDEESDRGYWLPVDAKSDQRRDWISTADVTDALKALNAKHVMVMADSCYSGTLVRGIKVQENVPDYIRKMVDKRARLVITSGGLEPVADSAGGKNSPFATVFLDVLKSNKGVMDGTNMFSKMRRPVMLKADQTPEYADVRKAGHEGGDFLFVRRK
jgi:hypothetical protein